MTKMKKYQLHPLVKALTTALPVALLATATIPTQANTLHIKNHWVRDYMDFGSNKGVFKPGAVGVQIQKKDGSIFKLPDLPLPDFSVAEVHGAAASLGTAYGLTVRHNNLSGGSILNPQYGHGVYKKVDHMLVNGGKPDIAYLRYNKFVVETTGYDEGADFSISKEEAMKRYGTHYLGNDRILVYRVGNGRVNLVTNGGSQGFLDAYNRDFQTGAIYEHFGKWGHGNFQDFEFNTFRNEVTPGDSGSMALVYDNIKKKWVVFGTTAFIVYGGGKQWYQATLFSNDSFNQLKEKWSKKVALNGGTLTFNEDGTAFKIDDGELDLFRGKQLEEAKRNDKDLVFSGGGTILLDKSQDLGYGGLIFDDNQKYVVSGKLATSSQPNNLITLSGAGLNVGKGTVVEWNVSGVKDNNMHQIGAGTVNYNVKQNNQLRIGNGTAVLNAEHTFDLVYMANGLGTIKLGHENALNVDGDMNNLIFTERGGTVDMNGHSLTFKRIAASDEGAIFTNTSDKRADLAIQNTEGRYQFHGQVKGNLNLIHKYDSVETPNAKATGPLPIRNPHTHLVLDGGTDIKGNIEVANASLTMQGLPTTHAIYRDDRIYKHDPTPGLNNIEGSINASTGKDWYGKNQPATFNQPDWETRLYKFDTLKLDNAQVDIGRNTIVVGNIDANQSTMNIGGDVNLYIDQYISKNITTEKGNQVFGFRQELHEGQSVANDTIYYEGNIKAKDSTFNAYLHEMKASFDLDKSSFKGEDVHLTQLLDKGIDVRNGSTLELGDVIVSGNKSVVEIKQDGSSSVSMGRLFAQNGHVKVNQEATKVNAIYAGDKGIIELPKWTMNEENSILMKGSELRTQDLTTEGLTRMGGALTVDRSLALTSLDPSNPYSSLAIVGLGAQKLTLGKDAKVSASFSDDYLATGNYTYNTKYALVTTVDGIDDKRTDSKIDFKLEGKLPWIDYKQDSHNITFEIKRQTPTQLAQKVEGQFFASASGRESALYQSILEHNANGGREFLQVAIDSALSNENITQGASSLANTITKADKMLNDFADAAPVKPMMSPVRQTVDNRVMSLRQVAYRTSPADYQLASMGGDLSMIGRAMDADAAHQSLFVDVGGSLVKDGSLHLRTATTSMGYDTILRNDDGSKTVLGAMFTLGDMSNRDDANNDNGRMYALTGYANKTFSNDVEFQTMLTAGLTSTSRTFTPTTIQVGAQSYRDRTYSLVSSNALKYRMPMTALGDYQVSFKPMLLADFAATYTREGRTDFMKRESTKDYSVDLGAGMEFVAQSDRSAWVAQVAMRHNVWNDLDAVGINLANASGYIKYDVDQKNTTELNVNLSTIQRVTDSLNVEASVGATSNTNGAKSVNGNVRVRYLF